MSGEATSERTARAPVAIERKLRRAFRPERRFYNARALLRLLIWIAALLLVGFLVDWMFLLPSWGRVALAVVLAGTLAWALYREWARFVRRYNPVRVALQVEKRHPGLRSLLVSYVQLDESKPGANASPFLIRALRRQAVETTAPMDFGAIVDFHDLRRVAMVSAMIVLGFGAMSLNWAEYAATFLHRMLKPSVRIAYPTRTRIETITGNVVTRLGAPVAIEAVGGGSIPREGRLLVKPDDGQWERLAVARSGKAAFPYRFETVFRSLTYRMRLGDAVSPEYRVTVVPPPRITATRIRLRYPDYTGRAPGLSDSLNLEAPEGTEVAWELQFDRPLQTAVLAGESTQSIPMQLRADGRSGTCTLLANASFPYRFRCTEREHGYAYSGDVQYFVRVLPNRAPEIELTEPREDTKATVRKKLALAFRAVDDYRLSQAWVVYSLNQEPEQRRSAAALDSAQADKDFAWTLREAIPDLKEGDVVSVAVEVADNRSGAPGPQRARSRAINLSIVSPEEYLRSIFEKRAQLVKEIEALHQDEEQASGAVKTLQKSPPAPTIDSIPTSGSAAMSGSAATSSSAPRLDSAPTSGTGSMQ
jgi:hypothetical protein